MPIECKWLHDDTPLPFKVCPNCGCDNFEALMRGQVQRRKRKYWCFGPYRDYCAIICSGLPRMPGSGLKPGCGEVVAWESPPIHRVYHPEWGSARQHKIDAATSCWVLAMGLFNLSFADGWAKLAGVVLVLAGVWIALLVKERIIEHKTEFVPRTDLKQEACHLVMDE
jgi:hypothetical protein